MESGRVSAWNTGLKDVHVGQGLMHLAKKIGGRLCGRFVRLPGCLNSYKYAE